VTQVDTRSPCLSGTEPRAEPCWISAQHPGFAAVLIRRNRNGYACAASGVDSGGGLLGEPRSVPWRYACARRRTLRPDSRAQPCRALRRPALDSLAPVRAQENLTLTQIFKQTYNINVLSVSRCGPCRACGVLADQPQVNLHTTVIVCIPRPCSSPFRNPTLPPCARDSRRPFLPPHPCVAQTHRGRRFFLFGARDLWFEVRAHTPYLVALVDNCRLSAFARTPLARSSLQNE
jgi:hypothetical protein